MKTGRPKIFISSRMATPQLRELRHELHRRYRQGSCVWLPDLARPELQGRAPEEAEPICLGEVRDCQGFVCVLDETYGSPCGIGELSVLETELFTAAVKRIPARVFLLAPFEPNPQLRGVLEMIQALHSGALQIEPLSGGLSQVADEVERAAEGIASSLRKRRKLLHYLSGFQDELTRRRSPVFDESRLDVRFLNGTFAPLDDRKADRDLILQLLEQAQSQEKAPEGLTLFWKAIRHLCAAPYSEREHEPFLPLWERALGQWTRAASWYGLHGYPYLSRLAALNTLLAIRSQSYPGKEETDSIHASLGAVASEYYSMARASSGQVRKRLMERALRDVNHALAAGQAEPSGLLAVRGSIRQEMGDGRGGLADYERVLRIRRERGDPPTGIGEAEVELGLGYLRARQVHRLNRAGDLMEAGVEKLRAAPPSGFTVRALRKLSLYYLLRLSPRRSQEALEEAYRIASELELEDQLEQIRRQPWPWRYRP